MSEDIRRSGRKRKRTARFEGENWDSLLEIVGAPSDDEATRALDEADDSGEEFVAPEEEAGQISEREDDLSLEEGSDKNASADGEEHDEDESEDGETVNPSQGGHGLGRRSPVPKIPAMYGLDVKKLKGVGTMPRPTTTSTSEQHTRGIRLTVKQPSRDKLVLKTFGRDPKDLMPLLRVRAKWFDEISLPSRKANKSGIGGLSHSFYVSDESRETEANKSWDWYFEKGGRAGFQKRQMSRSLSDKQAQTYTSRSPSSQDFVMGPVSRQKQFNLGVAEVLDVNKAMKLDTGMEGQNPTDESLVNKHKGWIFNIGGPAQCLEWVPNQADQKQYLAISTYTYDHKTSTDNPSLTAPGFAVADPSPATIQIWSFTASDETGSNATIDMNTPPQMNFILCFDWGDVKQFKWCPMLRDCQPIVQSGETYLGMLALITTDGKVRVLDITHPNITKKTITPQYLHIKTAAFESRPPDTICTCVTWLSPTLLAAGCANGYVAIWNLSPHLCQPPSTTDALPTFYHPIHISYITSIVSCWPSRPHLFLSSSPDGYYRLTSIHNPTSNTISALRSRVLCSNVMWHDQSQHAFCSDDTYTLRGYNLRNFFTSVVVSHEEAEIRHLASSALHPAMLVGYADGGVGVYNPLRRLMHRRNKQQHFRHMWWRHEWRRGRPSPSEPSDAADSEIDFPNGLSRLTTSFALLPLLHAPVPDSQSPKSQSQKPPTRGPNASISARTAEGGAIFTTIYEEKSGVKCLGWNPNLKAGGWAAVGWGTGLVVVEDLCWD